MSFWLMSDFFFGGGAAGAAFSALSAFAVFSAFGLCDFFFFSGLSPSSPLASSPAAGLSAAGLASPVGAAATIGCVGVSVAGLAAGVVVATTGGWRFETTMNTVAPMPMSKKAIIPTTIGTQDGTELWGTGANGSRAMVANTPNR